MPSPPVPLANDQEVGRTSAPDDWIEIEIARLEARLHRAEADAEAAEWAASVAEAFIEGYSRSVLAVEPQHYPKVRRVTDEVKEAMNLLLRQRAAEQRAVHDRLRVLREEAEKHKRN